MRFTLTPTPSNTATPSLTPSNTPSYTPTGTVCPGLTPTATATPPVTQTNTSTPTGTIQTTPTTTPPPTNTPTATLGGGGKQLMIYARDVAGTRATITMFYNVNSGANINIPGATGTQLPADCTYIYTITGLNNGDVVTVGTSINCVMTGAFGMIMTCPSSISSNIDFVYVMDAPAVQVISLTIDTDNIP
jgi:hypothetical protein